MISFQPSSVVVLFGGESHERLVSVASAQNLSSVLPDSKFWFWAEQGTVTEVCVSELRAHINPFTAPFVPQNQHLASSVSKALDTLGEKKPPIFLALHGGSGEDGTLQKELEKRRISFTGSSSLACSVAMDKPCTKEKVQPLGVKLAEQMEFKLTQVHAYDDLQSFQRQYGRIVLKPADEGSSVGLAFANSELEIEKWWASNIGSSGRWLAEEFLVGRELTIGVVMNNGSLIALPPSEVILERNASFDYNGKYLGMGNKEITPAALSPRQTAMVQEAALLAHTALGCYGYTRSEVFLTERGVFFLELNTLPGITQASFIPQQLKAAGIRFEDFVVNQLELAERRYE